MVAGVLRLCDTLLRTRTASAIVANTMRKAIPIPTPPTSHAPYGRRLGNNNRCNTADSGEPHDA